MEKFIVFLQYIYVVVAIESESLFERLIKNVINYDRIFTNIEALLKRTSLMVKNPRRYSREIVVLIALAFLVFLLILLGIIIALAIKRQLAIRKTYKSINLKLTKEQLARRLLILGIILFAFASLIFIGSSTPSFCARCHSIGKSVDQWEHSVHKEITCIGCHYEPGVFGYMIGTIKGASNLVAHVFKPPAPMQAIVPNNTCMNCHEDINERIVIGERKIMVKHKDIEQAGIPCISCHNQTAHQPKTAKTFAMNICVRCHNGKKARSDCKTCHQEDIAYKPHTTLEDWPKVKGAKMTCTGCHKVTTTQGCIRCHGLELPHSPIFIKKHAMQSEARRGLCYKCHWERMDRNGLCACHDEGQIHGRPEKWYYEHRAFAKTNGAGCNCHAPMFCERCHDDPASVYPLSYAGGYQSGMH